MQQPVKCIKQICADQNIRAVAHIEKAHRSVYQRKTERYTGIDASCDQRIHQDLWDHVCSPSSLCVGSTQKQLAQPSLRAIIDDRLLMYDLSELEQIDPVCNAQHRFDVLLYQQHANAETVAQ